MFCPYCGKTLLENTAFCMECGKKIPQKQAAATPNQTMPQTTNAMPPVQPPVQKFTPQAPQPVTQPTQQYAPVAQQPVSQQIQQPIQQPIRQQPIQQPTQQYTPPTYTPPTAPVAGGAPVVNIPVKSNPFGWIKWAVIGFVLLVGIIVTLFLLLHKTDEEKIRERIEIFAEAYDDGDMKEMFGCFDKRTRKTYELTLGLADGIIGGLTGYDLPIGDLFELGGLYVEGEFDIDITIKSITVDGDEAYVEVDMIIDGQAESDTFEMCKEGSDWYIDFEAMTGEEFGFDTSQIPALQ